MEIEATLGGANTAISPRVRRLILSSPNMFWIGALLSGSLLLMGSPSFVYLPAEVATLLLTTLGAVIGAAVT